MTDRIMNAEQRIKPMPTSPWTPWLPIHVPSETLLGRFMEGMTKQGSDAPVVSLRYPDESVIEYRLLMAGYDGALTR